MKNLNEEKFAHLIKKRIAQLRKSREFREQTTHETSFITNNDEAKEYIKEAGNISVDEIRRENKNA